MKRTPLRRSGPETVRIGQIEFQIPAGVSKARRRVFIAAAERHVLERGEITAADAMRLLRAREKRTARALGKIVTRYHRNEYARRPRDMDRMAWCRELACALRRPGAPHPDLWRGPPDVDRCRGHVEAHHAGEHGYGNKAPDDTVVPLCSGHHRALTDRTGIFAGWPRGAVKRWELAMVELYQRAYADHLASRSAAPNF